MSEAHIKEVLAEAQKLRASERDGEAIELLTDALASNTDARLFYSRSVQYWLADQNDLAIADVTRAIELDPRKPKYFFHRGYLQSHLKDNDFEAVLDFEKVLELDAEHVDAHREICLCLLLLGKPSVAWKHALAAARLDPDDATTHFCVGQTQMSLKQYDGAVASFAKATELNPERSNYWDALTHARERQNESETRDITWPDERTKHNKETPD
jgi:tetratricopeptide (TPR) repeat protein